MRKIIVGLIVLAGATDTAHAEGLRVELHAGIDGFDAGQISTSDSPDVFGGIGLGYDFAVGKRVFVGLEANLDESNDKDAGFGGIRTVASIAVNRDINVNTRVGINIGESGKARVYALAGYTNLRLKVTGISSFTPFSQFSISGNVDGYRAGLGAEYDIGKRVYGKIEYRYSDYEGSAKRNQGLVGIGIRF